MTITSTPATDNQMAYLRKLVADAGGDISQFLIERGITKHEGFPQPIIVARLPSKSEASRLIDELAPPRTSSYRRGARRRTYTTTRCTHEDYPCCGC